MHAISGEKVEELSRLFTGKWCPWRQQLRAEASVSARVEVLRGVDGNSSSFMVMVGLLVFNVYWVQFEIESKINYE